MTGADSDNAKRLLELWESERFSRLVRRRLDLPQIEPDIELPDEDLRESLYRVKDATDLEMAVWTHAPLQNVRDAIYVIALCILENPQVRPSNDLLVTRVCSLLCSDRYRAHPDGVVCYINGSFRRLEELQEPTMRRIEYLLTLAQKILRKAK